MTERAGASMSGDVYALYTARETADALGVVERTVRRWIEDGKLPAEKVGGAFRIKLEDAQRVYEGTRSGYSFGRAAAEQRVRWLEEENARLWLLLRLAMQPAHGALTEEKCPKRWSDPTYLGDGPWGA